MKTANKCDVAGWSVKLVAVALGGYFMFLDQWKYALFVLPVFLVDVCIPVHHRSDGLVSVFKVFLLLQGFGIWYLNTAEFFQAPLHDIQNAPIFQQQLNNWQNTTTMLRGIGEMSERTIHSLASSASATLHAGSIAIGGGAIGAANTGPKFNGNTFGVQVLSMSLHKETNELSRKLINATLGELLTTDFPDLAYRSKSEIQQRYTKVFSELPLRGFDERFKNPCWVKDSGGGDNKNSAKDSRSSELVCLPYAYILGQPKSGTSDLYERLKGHADIM